MREYMIERRQDAEAVAHALAALYPAYAMFAVIPKGARRYRIACHCKATGAFLQYAKM